MSESELIAETNRLLKELIGTDERQREEARMASAASQERLDAMKVKREDAMKSHLKELGLPDEGLTGAEADWEKRRDETMKRSRERLEEQRARAEQYQNELLEELRI